MRDSEIVAAIVAGDPTGLAAAYDLYAASLYSYCHSLLGEPDAADAVQDTFIIAASKLAGLRDRDRLRPWLYAVARNECHRRLRARTRSVGLEEVGDVTDEAAEVGVDVERAELRDLVHDAVAGLNQGDRELIELNLRHELQGADLAGALGVPANQAHALASRARNQFETSLGALLVARSGRTSCTELNSILAGWDGHLTVLLRKRLNRHIERCDLCGERKRHELRPAMLLGLLPVVAVPADLRRQVLRLVADETPSQTVYRSRVVRRAEPFGPSGFPVPVEPLRSAPPDRRYGMAAVAGVALFAVLGGAVVVAGLLDSGGSRAASSPHSIRSAAVPASTSSSPSATPTTSTTSPAAASSAPTVSAPAVPLPTTPVMTTQPSPTRSSKPPASPTRSATPGTLTAAPTSVTLAPPPDGGAPAGSFTLTAVGGPVASYTIAVPPGDAPSLVVTPSSGSLAAGQSVTITVTWNGESSLSSQLTVDPGGLQISVSWQPVT